MAAFGLTLKNKEDRAVNLPDLLAALQADGVISRQQQRQLNSNVRPKDLQSTHPITLVAAQAWRDAADGRLLNEEAVSRWLAKTLGLKYERIDPLKVDVPKVTALASFAYVSKRHILPIALRGDVATFATSQPLRQKWQADLGGIIGKKINVVMTAPSELEKYSLEFYALAKSVSRAGKEAAITAPGVGNLEQLVQLGEAGNLDANDRHIAHIVDWLMQFAFEQRASDIHMEPRRDISYVRFRIDGMLHPVYELPTAVMIAVISRVKSLGGMDIVDKRRPQDGRVKTRAPKGGEVELRLSTLPTAFGEKMVLRIFDPDVLVKNFSELGLTEQTKNTWLDMAERPNGLILVTGPTGSGKTTTLYSTLKHLARPEVNVCTIEDPIELIEPQFNQMQVNPTIQLNFSDGVRALLRQDPDIIMVGEVRDAETAGMAMQAALTGHLVLSTLHTNDAVATVSRLLEIGAPDYLLRATLLGVMAQRLLRTLCPHCLKSGALDGAQWRRVIHPMKLKQPETVNTATGCLECRNTGYLGRVGIYETLRVTRAISDLINPKTERRALFEAAVKEGMIPLNVSGAMKVAAGQTTAEEVLRVVSHS